MQILILFKQLFEIYNLKYFYFDISAAKFNFNRELQFVIYVFLGTY